MANEWNNITLEEFVKIRAILGDKEKDHEDKMIALAAIVQGVDEETILTMPLDRVQPIFARVQGLEEKPQAGKARKMYQVGKWSLRLTTAKDMTVAQWIDIQNYYREDMEKHLADILSVALVPVGKTYNEGYDPADVQRLIREYLPTSDAYAIAAFFLRTFAVSIRGTLTSSLRRLKAKRKPTQKEKATIQETEALLRSLRGGDGLRTLTRSLRSPVRAGAPSGTSPSPSSSTSSPTGMTS